MKDAGIKVKEQPPGLTFAITDMHGRFDLLEPLMRKVETYVGDTPATMIFCGDMVDRGMYSAQVVAYIRAGPTKPNWNWVCLYGNHEDLMLRFVQTREYDIWLYHGGYETLLSYGYDPSNPDEFDDTQLCSDAAWFKDLPLYYMDQHRFFSHAGADLHRRLKDQNIDSLTWNRHYDGTDKRFKDRYVVYGHTPHASGPIIGQNSVNLDCKAFSTSRLVAVGFKNDVGGAPSIQLEASIDNGPKWSRDITAITRLAYRIEEGQFDA